MFERVVTRHQIDATIPFHSVARAVNDCGVMLERHAAEVGQRPQEGGALRGDTLDNREAIRAEHRRYAPFVIRRADEGRQTRARVFRNDEYQGAPAFLS